jgi:predicted DsbA family dithiol-disulfide isomerase
VCAESASGYADTLFESQDLSEGACEELAVRRGIDREAFRACITSPATDARIDRDTAIFDSADGTGVPLLFVGAQRLEGEQSQEALESAIDAALAQQAAAR